MNTRHDVFPRLLLLAPDERIEVLRGLSLGARRRLLHQLANSARSTSRTRSGATTSRGRKPVGGSGETSALTDYEVVESLTHAKAESVATLLAREPAWVIRMVTGVHPWPWQREVIDRLPARLRNEVRSLVGPCTDPAPQVARELVAALASKLASGTPPPASRPGSRYRRQVKAMLRAATRWPGSAS